MGILDAYAPVFQQPLGDVAALLVFATPLAQFCRTSIVFNGKSELLSVTLEGTWRGRRSFRSLRRVPALAGGSWSHRFSIPLIVIWLRERLYKPVANIHRIIALPNALSGLQRAIGKSKYPCKLLNSRNPRRHGHQGSSSRLLISVVVIDPLGRLQNAVELLQSKPRQHDRFFRCLPQLYATTGSLRILVIRTVVRKNNKWETAGACESGFVESASVAAIKLEVCKRLCLRTLTPRRERTFEPAPKETDLHHEHEPSFLPATPDLLLVRSGTK
jgi:hypothetical protein